MWPGQDRCERYCSRDTRTIAGGGVSSWDLSAVAIASAKLEIVGLSKIARIGNSIRNCSRTLEITWVASREWPPRSKKLSLALMRSRLNTRSEERRVGKECRSR